MEFIATKKLLSRLSLLYSFGQAHVHCGLGIRKLGWKFFEYRGDRKLRSMPRH